VKVCEAIELPFRVVSGVSLCTGVVVGSTCPKRNERFWVFSSLG